MLFGPGLRRDLGNCGAVAVKFGGVAWAVSGCGSAHHSLNEHQTDIAKRQQTSVHILGRILGLSLISGLSERNTLIIRVAEGGGFEPPERLTVRSISSRVH